MDIGEGATSEMRPKTTRNGALTTTETPLWRCLGGGANFLRFQLERNELGLKIRITKNINKTQNN